MNKNASVRTPLQTDHPKNWSPQKPCSFNAKPMNRIVGTLFSANPVQVSDNSVKGSEELPLFCIKGLEEVVPSMKNKEGPEPNSVLTEVYKLVFHYRPDLLFEIFNAYLEGTFFLIAGRR